jgi:hypothetical protein
MALWYSETYAERVRLSLEVDRVLHSSRSRFQTIEIVEAPATGKTLILAASPAQRGRRADLSRDDRPPGPMHRPGDRPGPGRRHFTSVDLLFAPVLIYGAAQWSCGTSGEP